MCLFAVIYLIYGTRRLLEEKDIKGQGMNGNKYMFPKQDSPVSISMNGEHYGGSFALFLRYSNIPILICNKRVQN